MSTSSTTKSTRRSKRIQGHSPKRPFQEIKGQRNQLSLTPTIPKLNICTTIRRMKQFNKMRLPLGPDDSLFLKERIEREMLGHYKHKTDSNGFVLSASEPVQELMSLGQYICYLSDVDCFLYDRSEEKTYFLNGRTGEGEKENVKTLYFNKELEAIIMIYTCDMDPKLNELGVSNYKGDQIFQEFNFYYPDFIEFDEVNCVIVTRHATEGVYRIWSLLDYSMVVEIGGVYGQGYDIKTTPGIIVILRDELDALENSDEEGIGVVLDVLSITSGQHYGSVRLKGVAQENIMFCEMFRHYALMKLEGKDVVIIDLLTKEVLVAPDILKVNIKAFLFFNDVSKFLILSDGGEAQLVCEDLKTHFPLETIRPADTEDKDFTIATSANKNKMLYPSLKNQILIFDLWRLEYIARIPLFPTPRIKVPTDPVTFVTLDQFEVRIKAIFMDERNYQVLVADDRKFVHRLGLTPPQELEKNEADPPKPLQAFYGKAKSGLRSILSSLNPKKKKE